MQPGFPVKVLTLKAQVLFDGFGLFRPVLAEGVAICAGNQAGWVLDFGRVAPGLLGGSPGDMPGAVGQLSWRAEVVGVVVENLHRAGCGPRRLFGLADGVGDLAR